MTQSPPTPHSIVTPDGSAPLSDEGFVHTIGPLYVKAGGAPDGSDLFRMVIGRGHLDQDGFAHGGLLMTFAQEVLSRRAAAAMPDKALRGISVNCDFLASAPLDGVVDGYGEVTRRTRSIIFLNCTLDTFGTDGSNRRPALTATGLWKTVEAAPDP